MDLMHSHQKYSPKTLQDMNPDVKGLIGKLYSELKSIGYSYEQKETALHVVNEMLFHDLVTKHDDCIDKKLPDVIGGNKGQFNKSELYAKVSRDQDDKEIHDKSSHKC